MPTAQSKTPIPARVKSATRKEYNVLEGVSRVKIQHGYNSKEKFINSVEGHANFTQM